MTSQEILENFKAQKINIGTTADTFDTIAAILTDAGLIFYRDNPSYQELNPILRYQEAWSLMQRFAIFRTQSVAFPIINANDFLAAFSMTTKLTAIKLAFTGRKVAIKIGNKEEYNAALAIFKTVFDIDAFTTNYESQYPCIAVNELLKGRIQQSSRDGFERMFTLTEFLAWDGVLPPKKISVNNLEVVWKPGIPGPDTIALKREDEDHSPLRLREQDIHTLADFFRKNKSM